MVCLQRKRGKKSVGYIIEVESIQIVNSLLGHDPKTEPQQLNGKPFVFEVDSVAKDNFCSMQVG